MPEKAQTFVEYLLIMGVVVTALLAMNPMIKEFFQAQILQVADQIGNQANSDQPFDETGHLQESQSVSRARVSTTEVDYGNYVFNDTIFTSTLSVTNAGFDPGGP